jgi:hypothetical protein
VCAPPCVRICRVCCVLCAGCAVRACACVPVHVPGLAVYSPGGTGSPFADHAMDNSCFAPLLLTGHFHAWGNASLFCELEPAARRGLEFLPLMDGLVYNNPAAPNCTYGFTDTVAKQGHLLFSSLLLYQALTDMSEVANSTGCGNATYYSSVCAPPRLGSVCGPRTSRAPHTCSILPPPMLMPALPCVRSGRPPRRRP